MDERAAGGYGGGDSRAADGGVGGDGDAAGRALGGFAEAARLLEFDQVRQRLAEFARTPLGRERCRRLEAAADPLVIAAALQETTEARHFTDSGGALEFGPEQDLREPVERALLGGLLRGEELHALRMFVRAARFSRNELLRYDELPLLAAIAENLPPLGDLDAQIGAAISPAGEVLDYASPLLGRLRAEARQAQSRLNEIMERQLRRLQRQELVQEPLITQRNGRMVLLVKAEMRYRVPGIVHDVSDSGATVFVEPLPAVDLGNRWRESRLAQEREEERVLRQLSAQAGMYGEDLLLTIDLLARLDLNLAKARYSAELRAIPPIIDDTPPAYSYNAPGGGTAPSTHPANAPGGDAPSTHTANIPGGDAPSTHTANAPGGDAPSTHLANIPGGDAPTTHPANIPGHAAAPSAHPANAPGGDAPTTQPANGPGGDAAPSAHPANAPGGDAPTTQPANAPGGDAPTTQPANNPGAGRYPTMGETAADDGMAAGGRELRLVRARHPLLAGPVVPIDLTLNESAGVLLITGPNAGGKTVALKTVGLLALMAHAGLHLPAQEARIPLLDGVYADIGDQQSIQQSLSTFSSHIANLRSIMTRATARSLALIDELGSSTDPEEGSALACAILRHFQRMGVLLVGTTHYRGVARAVQEQPGMVNASVDLDPSTLAPTYHLTTGLPGRSYALTIAARLGFPQEIIDGARAGISPVEQATESLLQELQRERAVVETLRAEAQTAQAEAARLRDDLERQLESVETTKANLVEDARRRLQQQTAALQQRLQQLERQLSRPPAMDSGAGAGAAAPPPTLTPEELAAYRNELRRPPGRTPPSLTPPALTPEELAARRAELRQVERQLDSADWQPIEVRRTPWQERLQSGDRVYLQGLAEPVEVITPPGGDERLEVLLGVMRATVPVYQLERPAEAHPAAARQRVYLDRRAGAPRRPAYEMDLRGFRVDEAIARLEAALNDAALDGADTLRIIHGKGTGALRRGLREFLTTHPLAQSHTDGEGPGGEGVTIVRI